jgi:phosphatidylglycerophosphate synthase
MLDRRVLVWIKPPVDALAKRLAATGVSANALTFAGFGLGLSAALLISQQYFLSGLGLILVSRLMDALDGAVARCTRPSDRGAFLDITLDFLFYASIPLGFALASPLHNALPAALLLAAFMGTSSSFLAFAILANKRKLASTAFPTKSFYFLGGLTEASETILFFAAMCLWPAQFPVLALIFAGLCLLTTVTRLYWGWQRLAPGQNELD